MNKKSIHLFFCLVLATTLFSQTFSLQEEQDYRFAIQLENRGLFDIAALQFEKYAHNYPHSLNAPEALLKAGENFERADSLLRASNLYLNLLLKYPQYPQAEQAQIKRAALYEKNGEHLLAAMAFDRLKIISAKSDLIPEAQINAAEEFLKAGESQRAFDAAFYILEQYPTHSSRLQAHYIIAKIYNDRGDYFAALQGLDRLTAEKIDGDFALKVFLLKSETLKKLGHYSKSDSLLLYIVDSKYSNELTIAATLELAQMLQKQCDYERSNSILSKTLGDTEQKEATKMILLQGDNYFLLKKYQEALSSYNKIDIKNLSSADYFKIYFRMGKTNQILDNIDVAVDNFNSLLNDSTVNEKIKFYAAIECAKIFASNGKELHAVRLLQNELIECDNDELRNRYLLMIASIFDNSLQDYERARQNYYAILSMSPTSIFIDDAQFRIAGAYEKEGDYKRALEEYSRYIKYYPGGDFLTAAEEKAATLEFMIPASNEKITSALNNFMLQNSQNNAVYYYNLAQQQINLFKNFEEAIILLNKALQTDLDESLDKAEIYSAKADCYYALYKIFKNRNQKVQANEQRELLKEITTDMAENFPNSSLTQQVKYKSAQVELENMGDLKDRIDFFKNELDTTSIYTDTATLYKLKLQCLDDFTRTDSSETTLLFADSLLDKIIKTQKNVELLEDAYLKKIKILKQIGLADSALKTLTSFQPTKSLATFLFLQAELYEKLGYFIDAQRIYAEIVDNYFYSSWAAKASKKLISLMIKQGQYQEAQKWIRQKQSLVPPELEIFYGDDKDNDLLWFSAQVSRYIDPPPLSFEKYRMYLSSSDSPRHKSEALLAIAELANELNKKDVALGHFEELASTANDTMAQIGLLKTAEIYFDRGLYENAREKYIKIKKLLTGKAKKEAFRNEIICEYRLGNLSRAADFAKQFKKEFDDRNAEARFLYEEGMMFIQNKDFNRAEKTLKTLSSKYDDVPEGARGDLGLARLYVVQTKTDEALERLTEIPKKYNDPDIVATAYVNLADFYYENRQLENCILAGQKVLDLQEKGLLRSQAMDLLINAYDELRMRDRAIALQREYIELYPYDPSIINRKIRLGIFLYDLKEFDRAISHLKSLKPIISADNEAEVQYWIAMSYADAGFTEQAIIEFLKVRFVCKPTKLPWGVTALYKAGQGYQKLGNLAKAREMFELVVKERGVTDNIGREAQNRINEIEAELSRTS